MAKNFETKDSGRRVEFDSGMRRDVEAGKARFDFLFWPGVPYEEQFITRWAMLMARGAEKYGEFNFIKADSRDELARFKRSALRHCVQFFMGEQDEDHGAATAYNVSGAVNLEAKLRLMDSGLWVGE